MAHARFVDVERAGYARVVYPDTSDSDSVADEGATNAFETDSDTSDSGSDMDEHLSDARRLAYSYMSCPAIDFDADDERWLSLWDDSTTNFLTHDSCFTATTWDVPWCASSRITMHISPSRADFTDLSPVQRNVSCVDGDEMSATGIGTIILRSGGDQKLILKNALYVPEAPSRVISIGSLTNGSLRVSFGGGACIVETEDGRIVAEGKREGTHPYYISGHASRITDDPRTYREAMARDDAFQWKRSLTEELKSLKKHGVWTLVPRNKVPEGRRIIPSKVVFTVQRKENKNSIRHISRVVANGSAQQQGVDYTDTYAPVARMESVRAVLHVGATLDWEIHRVDIESALLHGELTHEVYMEQPEGCKEKGKQDWVCQLKKTLHGLVQAPRMWNHRLNKLLVKEKGYTRVSVDDCAYVRTTKEGTSIVVVHVDSLCVAASSMAEMTKLKSDLRSIFDLVDHGEVQEYLGITIERDRVNRTVSLSQTAYIEEITKRLKLLHAHPVYTPLDSHVTLSQDMCPQTVKEKEKTKGVPYRTAIGSVMYAALCTRPDVAFAVSHLSQFNANPGQAHWTQAQQVIKYLYTTRHTSLVLGGKNKICLSGWVDCDWGSNRNDRRSASSYLFTLGGGVISWSSKKQKTLLTSTTEAECMANSRVTAEALWLRNLLTLLGFEQRSATNIACDKYSAVALTQGPSFHGRTRHIHVQHHFVRECIQFNEISFSHIMAQENPADVLTRPLPRPAFSDLVQQMGLQRPRASVAACGK
jgi:Reverse transcriptase (RNA-dependent DNA polymerase)/Pol polyprotein, beta-barrel domain